MEEVNFIGALLIVSLTQLNYMVNTNINILVSLTDLAMSFTNIWETVINDFE